MDIAVGKADAIFMSMRGLGVTLTMREVKGVTLLKASPC
jgi:hypothetical protein